ncbi:hypothetical protein ACSSS7_000623 [Eimeria intestinalis]
MIMGGIPGAPVRLGATKHEGEQFGGNKWLLLLAMRSQNFEDQKLVSQKILKQRQQLLQLPTGEPAPAPATVPTENDAPLSAKQQQPQLLMRRQQLLVEQEQLLLEEQRLQREQQRLKRQHAALRPPLCQRLRQMFPSIHNTTSGNNSSKPNFLGEALRQQRLLLSSRPFASLQLGRWAGFRLGCLFLLESSLHCTLERELQLSAFISRPITCCFSAIFLHKAFLNQQSIFVQRGSLGEPLKSLSLKRSFLWILTCRAVFDFTTAAAAAAASACT